MKKYLLMLLAATTLSLGFTSCGSDDEEVKPTTENKDQQGNNDDKNQQGNNEGENQNGQSDVQTADFDFSSLIGLNVRQLIEKLGEPTQFFDGIYFFEFANNQKIEAITVLVNPENNQVYTVMEDLAENAYALKDLTDYFDKKYTFYTLEANDGNEEEGIEPEDVYYYGNTKNEEDATLSIAVSSKGSIAYTDPKNTPAIPEGSTAFDAMNPEELISFLGADFNELQEQFGNPFSEVFGMLYASSENSEWINAISVSVNEGIVKSVSLFFEAEPQAVLNFFRNHRWQIQEIEAEEEEEEGPAYLIIKGNIYVHYDGIEMATAIMAGSMDEIDD